jgi:hypothetical protein
MQWVETRLESCSDPADLLVDATEMQRFITRTTFWFDVWGSITKRRQPRFMTVYRALFGTAPTAFIGDRPSSPSAISMVNIIGCSNYSFRAMAEIAALAAWKDDKAQSGALSNRELVLRANEIHTSWLDGEHVEPQTPPGQSEKPIDFQRRIASEVFRASAKVYLHMVTNQATPKTPEIKEGVQDVINLLERIPLGDVVNTAIVRSVISAICICGCLAEDHSQVDFFLKRLDSLGEEAELFGNCRTVKLLIQRVWQLRVEQHQNFAVDWREVLMEHRNDVVLLV